MFEKVNPSHPDKIADRIAGAIVDLAYSIDNNPKVAIEVLIGHNICTIIAESSVKFNKTDIKQIVHRISRTKCKVYLIQVAQNYALAKNQEIVPRCGDNGIFKGIPMTKEERALSDIARSIYDTYKSDGKYIICDDNLIICQSNANAEEIEYGLRKSYSNLIINPLGYWTGGIDVDSGATNRKLGSDMGNSVTGGGLHGKDFSKPDVSVNIYAFLKAQETGKPVYLNCAIGDAFIDGKPYAEIIEIAKKYIKDIGGFEKFAEWGLV